MYKIIETYKINASYTSGNSIFIILFLFFLWIFVLIGLFMESSHDIKVVHRFQLSYKIIAYITLSCSSFPI